MRFEWDEGKSVANRSKHGIDFHQALTLWKDPRRLTSTSPSAAEPRERVVGRIGDKIWTAIITRRGDAIRLISVRRARDNEQKEYETA